MRLRAAQIRKGIKHMSIRGEVPDGLRAVQIRKGIKQPRICISFMTSLYRYAARHYI